jgi:hypothetical protein
MMLINIALVTWEQLQEEGMPRPSAYSSIGILFFILTLATEFGRSARSIAVGFGGLITLAIAMQKATGGFTKPQLGTVQGINAAESVTPVPNGETVTVNLRNRKRPVVTTGLGAVSR